MLRSSQLVWRRYATSTSSVIATTGGRHDGGSSLLTTNTNIYTTDNYHHYSHSYGYSGTPITNGIGVRGMSWFSKKSGVEAPKTVRVMTPAGERDIVMSKSVTHSLTHSLILNATYLCLSYYLMLYSTWSRVNRLNEQMGSSKDEYRRSESDPSRTMETLPCSSILTTYLTTSSRACHAGRLTYGWYE
jgi:hypothetical protein